LIHTPLAFAAGIAIGLALSWFWLWRPAVAMVAEAKKQSAGAANAGTGALEQSLAKERQARGEVEARCTELQAQLETSSADRTRLQRELDRLRSANGQAPDGGEAAANAALQEALDEARRRCAELEARLAAQSEAPGIDVDDLKQVKGIGKAIERRLKALGIRNLDQLAAMSQAEIEKIDNQLEFRGRMTREDWAGQARALITPR